jgi:hypothetical protein
MKYETGKWHIWEGKSDCPFDAQTTDFYVVTLDGSGGHYFDHTSGGPEEGVNVTSKTSARWDHKPGIRKVIAFYIVSYNEPKEMTVSDVEKALGHKVKIVK